MAIMALGGVRITKPRHLAMIGRAVAFEFIVVAGSAILCDGKLDEVIIGRVNAVRRMTVAAHRHIRVTLALDCCAVYRAIISFQRLLMTSTADLDRFKPESLRRPALQGTYFM